MIGRLAVGVGRNLDDVGIPREAALIPRHQNIARVAERGEPTKNFQLEGG